MSRVGWLRLVIVVGIFALLEAACRLPVIPKDMGAGKTAYVAVIDRKTMIPPTEMVQSLSELLGTKHALGGIVETLTKVVVALVASVLAGFLAGLVIHAIPRVRRALDPFFATYYAVPFFVFYPILIALLGLNQRPVIAIAFLFAVVAMIINTLNGLDRIPRVLTKVSRVHHMGWWASALKLKLPATAPYLFTGLKLAVAYSFIGVIASEFIMSTSGLGYEISYAYNNFQNRKMYGLMLFVMVLVIAINMALYLWEQNLLRRRRAR